MNQRSLYFCAVQYFIISITNRASVLSSERIPLHVLDAGYCYGVVSYKATIFYLLHVPIWVLIVPDSSTRAVWQIPEDT
jgi:hypothetical protein